MSTPRRLERPPLRRTEVAVDHAASWALLIPPGWTTFDTDEERSRAQVKRLIDRKMKGQARDEKVQARVEADRRLRQMIADARDQGVTKVHLATEPVAGVPVSASLVVAPRQLDGEDAFGRALADADGVVELSPVEIGGRPAVRCLRRTHGRIDEDPEAPEEWRTIVEYVVDVAPAERLVLTFSTTSEPVADALVVVFDAIASTLRPEPGQSPH